VLMHEPHAAIQWPRVAAQLLDQRHDLGASSPGLADIVAGRRSAQGISELEVVTFVMKVASSTRTTRATNRPTAASDVSAAVRLSRARPANLCHHALCSIASEMRALSRVCAAPGGRRQAFGALHDATPRPRRWRVHPFQARRALSQDLGPLFPQHVHAGDFEAHAGWRDGARLLAASS